MFVLPPINFTLNYLKNRVHYLVSSCPSCPLVPGSLPAAASTAARVWETSLMATITLEARVPDKSVCQGFGVG